MSWLHGIGSFIAGVVLVIGNIFSGLTYTPQYSAPAPAPTAVAGDVSTDYAQTNAQPNPSSNTSVSAGGSLAKSTTSPNSSATPATSTGQIVYTQDQLLAMAGNPYADGNVPLGDYKYVTNSPKKGYVYLCNVHKDNPGSMVNGPWMSDDTWNFLQKVSVSGSVSWPTATFSNTISGAYRVLSGNDLPISHNTGVFPVASGDPAHAYDANPNTISAQTLSDSLPANPVYSDTPYCMGGEVGVMLTGVALFDAFDAGLRDAPAHELQDSCDGHPQGSGEYHYHSMPSCLKDIMVTTVLGYAYDGFPITGPEVAPGKFLTTNNLDECHGLTSTITMDGKQVTTYHYVMTQDFPYSASCFRAKPITTGPSGGAPTQGASSSGGGQTQLPTQNPGGPASGGAGSPPQGAIDACAGKSVDSACTMQTPGGSLSGTCRTPPNSSLACIPN